MSDNWNSVCMLTLALAGFLAGQATGKLLWNITVVVCGIFLLLVANGMATALKQSLAASNHPAPDAPPVLGTAQESNSTASPART